MKLFNWFKFTKVEKLIGPSKQQARKQQEVYNMTIKLSDLPPVKKTGEPMYYLFGDGEFRTRFNHCMKIIERTNGYGKTQRTV
jgi:hypothetical protein